jgi:hypothetical protein
MEPENRQHYRLPVQRPVYFKILRGKNLDERTPPLSGMIKNISLGGIQFGTNTLNHGDLHIFNEFERTIGQTFRPNLLLVKFSLPEEKEPFIIFCHPRWSARGDLVDPYEFYIGVKFIKAKSEDLERLRDYIYKNSNEAELKNFYHQKNKSDRKKKTEEILIQKYVLAALPIRYQIISAKDGKMSLPVNAVTRNLSAFGLCAQVENMDMGGIHMVFNDNPINRNTLHLEILISRHKTLSVIGEVMWFERVSGKENYNYNVGVKFLKISEKDIKTIVDFLRDKPEDLSVVSRRG